MKKIKLAITLILFGTITNAQILISKDLDYAIGKALQKNTEIRNQDLELQKLELERKSILAKYIPKVEASGLYSYISSDAKLDLATLNLPITGYPVFGGSSDFSTNANILNGGITAKAVLFSGGQILNGAKALKEKNTGTAFMMENQKNEVIKDIIGSFDRLKLLETAEKLIDNSEKRLNKEKERVEKAISEGLAIPYDRDKIKLSTLELASKRADVQNKRKLLILKIKQSTNLSEEEILKTNHQLEPIIILDSLSTAERNEVKALESFKKASEYALKKEKGSLLPTVGAFAGYSYASLYNANTKVPIEQLNTTANLKLNELTLHPNWMLGVAVKWELFSGFERKHKIDEAKIGLAQVENKLADTKEKVDLELEKNKVEYNTTIHKVDIAIQREKIAQNNNEIASKQYRLGLINVTERLGAENDIYKESLNKVETVIEQRNAAIEVYRASGKLSNFIKIQN
ncbi:TolC family protein [Chryseobacterium indologenes]|uniref:TolC family protein n=1 Tax=Chryseobacterium oryzae TaxID=2929799 RepID=A0ABY4BLP2_9FLAO|nr:MULTISPECIES: TolC family protein [Chryseobacterium]AYZ35147.1 TolC family protein [Chryseobacterium indologenes]MEB4762921.1 TolC family protein [Chryseobacterium indologenes]UEQ78105.1 TolC family protein [Chryseobacterium arthrosphaerae]UOE37510.1 TolC family protein [Chryseobacterium oryzae]